ncbi:MAG: alpha/beta hydrolase family protein [Methylococcaceae bacterium]
MLARVTCSSIMPPDPLKGKSYRPSRGLRSATVSGRSSHRRVIISPRHPSLFWRTLKSDAPSPPIGLILLLCIMMLLLEGCFGGPQLPKTADIQDDMATFSEKPHYEPPGLEASPLWRETWQHSGRTLDVSYMAPLAEGRYPLILYFPGLGEDAAAGHLWRSAWVAAGYAVLTLQATHDRDATRHLNADDQHDLRMIAHPRFSREASRQRLLDVDYVLKECQRLREMGDPAFRKADDQQLIVAGYDLGAQTAALLAGEQHPGAKDPAPIAPVIAGILLSPHVDLAAGGLESRYDRIDTPLLIVTGTEDHDPYGISSPSLRTAIFKQSPPGQKYLLMLDYGLHQQLAGKSLTEQDPDLQEHEESPLPDEAVEAMNKGQHGRRGGSSSGRHPPAGSTMLLETRFNPHHYGQQLTAIATTSVAFLDATVKHSPKAAHWLASDSTAWLGKIAVLQHR